MSGLCLMSGAAAAMLLLQSFTLSWTHTVEKTRWEEDWRIVGGQLVLAEARVQGSGAGMEPGPGATLDQGWWRWQPDRQPMEKLILARSKVAADHLLCLRPGACRALSELIEGEGEIALQPCG
ncbi:MAG: DUF1850 domain-containing protein [Rhodospirillales bacterium]|nr:DUF1850 domain-containing protein [Rhodospirillales bacterium]